MPWSLRMVSYAAIIFFIIFIYFGFRYFRSIGRAELKAPGLYKIFYFVAAILFFSYPVAGLLQFRLQGSFDRTGWPDPIIYLFWYGLVFMGVMLNWLILHDLLLPVVKQISKKPIEVIRRNFARLFLILTALTLVYTALKMAWDTNRITTEEIEYRLPGADTSFVPLTIVHIADLHADEYTGDAKMARYVRKVNGFNPDLVLFGGDLITSGTGYVESGADALGSIEATNGVYAVLGDHDYWTDTDYIIEALQSRGIAVLDDENAWINHNGSVIKLTGITELYSSGIQPDSLAALLDESRNEILSILFSHQASGRLIERSAEAGVHQLFGAHTHGGQIRVPVFFYPLTAVRAETRYVNGHWMLNGMLLNVNSGLGFTLSPVRYNAPARVSVIRVMGEDAEQTY